MADDDDDETAASAANAGRRQRRIAIGLASLIALVRVGLGLLSILSGEHSGSSRRGAVFFEGSPARWMGAAQISLGMTALALTIKTRAGAMKWMGFWLACAALAFVLGLRAA